VLLSASGFGSSQGAILHAGTSQVASSSNPAVVGELLEIYVTGLVDGGTVPPQITIGDRVAEILFFGNAPGFAGLNQVNVRVPGISPGSRLYRVRILTNMTTSTIEEKTQTAAGASSEPKPAAKAKATKAKPVVAPAKAKSAKKATKAKKGTDTAPQAPAVAPKKPKSGKRATPAEKPASAIRPHASASGHDSRLTSA
jgi:hypothetical protein